MPPLSIDATARVAILAGGGELPLSIAASVTRRGGTVHMVAIEGEAGAEVEAYPHTRVNLAQAKRMFAVLRGEPEPGRTSYMVIAGAVTRPDLLKLRPDFGAIPMVFQLLALITAGGDDALLTKAIRIFERQGLTVVGVQDVAPELLIGEGVHGRHHPDQAAAVDLAHARAVLDALGDFDVGQGVVVEGGRVLAIEGVEGTDRMLERLARLGIAQRAVLLKAPKPRQERRVDLPTIGLRTVANARAAGIRGIGVIADESLGLQRHAMIEAADRDGMFLAGLPAVAAPRHAASPAPQHSLQTDILTARRPRPGDLADAERGAAAVLRLHALMTGQAAAVLRGHVLGVTAAEPPQELLARVRRLAPWGLARFSRRRGAVVVRAAADDPVGGAADLASRTADAGFGALAFVVDRGDRRDWMHAAGSACAATGLALIVMRADLRPLPNPQ